MNYALVQASLDQPDLAAMRRAFAHAPTLAPMDADILGNDAFGILVKGKTFAVATAIQSALQAEGVETLVVAEDQLPELPPTKFVNRVDYTSNVLLICDPLGRSFPVEWKDIMLIAAGCVTLSEFNPVLTEEKQVRMRGKHIVMETVAARIIKEERQPRLMIELILTGGVARYTIKADASAPFLFQCLGERRTNNLPQNFATLVRDLCQFAPESGLNRGAYYLREHSDQIFPYPSKNAFYEEITWLLWRRNQAQ